MHIPVLLREVIQGLDLRSNNIVVDGTLGGAGHTEAILIAEPSVRCVGIDLDADAIDRARARLKTVAIDGREPFFYQGNFSDIDTALASAGYSYFDRLILDLGWSSFQVEVDGSGRGFSFLRDEPLLMTFKKNPTLDDVTASTIVNEWEEKNIADIIYGFGEESHSRRIAKAIVNARHTLALSGKRIETTGQLAEIIVNAVPFWYRKGRLHPATKTFQALRIAVNGELDHLNLFLEKAKKLVSIGGRIAIISFHSLEDRIVKHAFRDWVAGEKNSNEQEGKLVSSSHFKLITKRPIIATEEEIRNNPRARSAKLRIIERIN